MSSRPETPTQIQEASVEIIDGPAMITWMLSSGQKVEKKKRRLGQKDKVDDGVKVENDAQEAKKKSTEIRGDPKP